MARESRPVIEYVTADPSTITRLRVRITPTSSDVTWMDEHGWIKEHWQRDADRPELWVGTRYKGAFHRRFVADVERDGLTVRPRNRRWVGGWTKSA